MGFKAARVICIFTSIFLGALGYAHESQFPSVCIQNLLEQTHVELREGKVDARVFESAKNVLFRAWENDPHVLMELAQAARDQNSKDMRQWPYLNQSNLLNSDGTLANDLQIILRSMVVWKDNQLEALRSPFASEPPVDAWNEAPAGEPKLSTDQLNMEYFVEVAQVAHTIRQIIRAEGLHVTERIEHFLHPSSHTCYANGAIGLVLQPSAFHQGATLPAFLMTPWGRYLMWNEIGLTATSEQAERIQLRIQQVFELRLLQSERLDLYLQGPIFELKKGSKGQSLPRLYRY